MANEVNVDPRYLSYSKDEAQALLDKVNNADAQPTAESANMISSGAVAAALGNYDTKEEIDEKLTTATEQNIRNIVKNYDPNAQPEQEEEDPGE